jgi:hypothetical protein
MPPHPQSKKFVFEIILVKEGASPAILCKLFKGIEAESVHIYYLGHSRCYKLSMSMAVVSDSKTTKNTSLSYSPRGHCSAGRERPQHSAQLPPCLETRVDHRIG